MRFFNLTIGKCCSPPVDVTGLDIVYGLGPDLCQEELDVKAKMIQARKTLHPGARSSAMQRLGHELHLARVKLKIGDIRPHIRIPKPRAPAKAVGHHMPFVPIAVNFRFRVGVSKFSPDAFLPLSPPPFVSFFPICSFPPLPSCYIPVAPASMYVVRRPQAATSISPGIWYGQRTAAGRGSLLR